MARPLLFQSAMVRVIALVLILATPVVCRGEISGPLIPPGSLADALAFVESNRIPEAVKTLGSFRPDMATLGAFHYVSGRMYAALRKPLEAASSYRRASIYAKDTELKEVSLYLAAETESGMGHYFEAKSECLVFMKRFPSSTKTRQIRILLARSLAGAGRFREAVRQFELAGDFPEALYGKANALQRMGMTGEASRAYAAGASADRHFPDSSEETRYWLAENLRLSGDTAGAKVLLRTITGDRLRDLASIGLAEIASADSRPEEAVKVIEPALSSREKKTRRLALLRMADFMASAGKSREAAARLEEIVSRHPFTREYDEAVLRLSKLRAKGGDEAGALSLLTKLVLRSSSLRREALDGIEGIFLSARGKGGEKNAALWRAGGRWLMDPRRESVLVPIAEELKGTGEPYLELVRWLSRHGSVQVRVESLIALARAYAEAGDAVRVRECLADLKGRNAPGDEMLRVSACLKFAEKDYRGACEALLSLRKIEGKDAAMLAETLPYAGDPGKTAAALERLVSGSAADPRVLSRLADALFDSGRKADAVKYYRMAAEKDPGNEWACYRAAVLLGRDGGEEYLKKIRTDPLLLRMAQAARKEMTLDAR